MSSKNIPTRVITHLTIHNLHFSTSSSSYILYINCSWRITAIGTILDTEHVLFVSESLSHTYGLAVLMWSWKFHYKTQLGPIFAPEKWRHCEAEVLFVEQSMHTSFRRRIRLAKPNNRLGIFPKSLSFFGICLKKNMKI